MSPGNGTARLRVQRPPAAALSSGLGFAGEDVAAGEEIPPVIAVRNGRGSEVVLDEVVIANASGTGVDRELDLEPWSGQTVSLEFSTVCDEGDVALWAAWSKPEVFGVGASPDPGT